MFGKARHSSRLFYAIFRELQRISIMLKAVFPALLFFLSFEGWAQVDSTLTDSILKLSDAIRLEPDEKKLEASARLETLLSTYYSNVVNFDNSFGKIPYIGQLESPDGKLKMVCWNAALEKGDFKYFCVLRYKPSKEEVFVTVFEDSDEDWSRINRKPIRPSKWYGALYYKILANKYKGKTYYTLLGWDGKDNITNRKVVDVLNIQGKSVILGASMFKDEQEKPVHRLIYEYANDVSMALNYDETEKMIVMDHLAPEDSRFVGQYQFYGPDFSYDALQFKKGEWVYLRDVFAKNRSLNNLPKEARPGDFKD